MPPSSIGFQHLVLHSALDVHDLFRTLGYDIAEPYAFEGDDLSALEYDDSDVANLRRVYIVSRRNNHTIYLLEVNDLRMARLRGLAWHALQRGSALLVLTRDYRDLLFVDPRLVGTPNKSNVRVNKLKLVVGDATRHDLDTLNAIHAHRRTGIEIYQAQGEAFNVNTITRKFYDEYRRHYEQAREAIRTFNPGIREFVDADKTDKLHAFTQRLLGRLMFLYFLQRKGWLGGRGKFLTDQYRDMLRQHADDPDQNRETFYYYQEVLTPLFFETMNTRRLGNGTRWPGVLIPYLNGGLFDPARDPEGLILLPDSLFDPNSNDGLLAFFNRYNFTIADDTPLEQDVAVDPEMLGKVFENLLEERDRGQSGSFYTPRSIVAYMCQEALAGYLEESAKVPRELTRAQFDPDSTQYFSADQALAVNKSLDSLTVLDPAVGSGSFLIGMLNEIIRLRRVSWLVLNPAESHGATQDVPAQTLSEWKERIIQDTLYGVDIKPEAIEIAQLRLWLALIVEQTLEQARPLPNLDYKLMAGDSLIETIDGEPILGESADALLDDTSEGESNDLVQRNFIGAPVQERLALFDSEKAVHRERVKLDDLRRKFFRATPEERRDLREEITEQERRIVFASLSEKTERLMEQIEALGKKSGLSNGVLKRADQAKLDKANAKLARLEPLEWEVQDRDKPLPFFLYRLHFHEVFAKKGGFDVVIANPPYVRQEQITHLKAALELAYPNVYAGTADLYVYFYARGLDLARTNGTLVYITPNKFMRAGYGKRLRSFLRRQTTLDALIDFGDLPLFDATSYPLIVSLHNAAPDAEHALRALIVESVTAIERMAEVAHDAFPVSQSALSDTAWQLCNPLTQELMDTIRAVGASLEAYVGGKAFYGIKTGLNAAFELDAETREQLIASDPSCAEVIRPWLRGRSISPWAHLQTNSWLLYVPWRFPIDDFPTIRGYLSSHRERLERRAEVKSGRHPWYALNRYAADYVGEFSKPKIVYQVLQVKPAFTIDKDGHLLNNSVWMICLEDYYLLGVLNSTLGWYQITQTCTAVQNGYQLIWDYFKKVVIADCSDGLRSRIAELAQRCLAAAKEDPQRLPPLEAKLNALVYQAYGLSKAEIQLIDSQLTRQRNEESPKLDASDDVGEDEE